jgi:hypothetical protein
MTDAKEQKKSQSLFAIWWNLRKDDSPFWKVFWLFWFAPATFFRFIYVLGMYTIISNLHLDFSTHLALGLGLLGLIALPFDFYGLYVIVKARTRCKQMIFALAAMTVIGLYVFQDSLSMLSLLHHI